MKVAPGTGKPSHLYNTEIYHFCSQKCHDKFVVDPYFYINGSHKTQQKAATKATEYTCPMHPEIIQDHPGDCPKCGMALEPMGAPSADESPNEELIDFTRRFWVSVALALPLLVLTMGEMVGLPFERWIGAKLSTWLQLAPQNISNWLRLSPTDSNWLHPNGDNGSKWLQMVPNGLKWLKMAGNGLKWLKIA